MRTAEISSCLKLYQLLLNMNQFMYTPLYHLESHLHGLEKAPLKEGRADSQGSQRLFFPDSQHKRVLYPIWRLLKLRAHDKASSSAAELLASSLSPGSTGPKQEDKQVLILISDTQCRWLTTTPFNLVVLKCPQFLFVIKQS